MTEQARDRIAAAFERELAGSPMPPDLRAQVVRGAVDNREELTRPRQQWALALVAVLLAIAFVATLVGVRALHSSAPTPAKHGPPITLHHNGYLVVSNDKSLIAYDPVTGAQHKILSETLPVSDAAYSPDGTRLAYVKAGSSIWVLDTRTGRTVQLTTCQCVSSSHISWSPDGLRLAFTDRDKLGGLAINIYLLDVDGTHRTQLTQFSGDFGISQPSWSPDGTRIAFNRQGNIDVIKIDGSGLAVLSGGVAWDPAWSPDGSRIAYVLDPISTSPQSGGGFEYQLWLMDPDGSHRAKIFVSPRCCVRAWGGPAWSPDATQIAVVALPTEKFPSGYALWVMNADGSDPRDVASPVAGDRPTWQPLP